MPSNRLSKVTSAGPSAPSPSQTRRKGTPSRSEAIVTVLREQILGGELEAGSPLRFTTLHERFGVSMGTIREALTILASSRLVVAEGQRGFRVAPLSMDDLEDIMSRRLEIDTLALRLAIQRGDTEWEARIVAAFHRLSKAGLTETSVNSRTSPEVELRLTEFYRALVEACQSPWLLHFHDMLAEHSGRYRRLPLSVSAKKVLVKLAGDFEKIMTTTLARDADAACAALARLFEATLGLSKEALSNALADTGKQPAKER